MVTKERAIAVVFLIFSLTMATVIAYQGINAENRIGFLLFCGLTIISAIYLVGGLRFKQAADPISRQFFSRAGSGPDLSPKQTLWALLAIAVVLLIAGWYVYSQMSQPIV